MQIEYINLNTGYSEFITKDKSSKRTFLTVNSIFAESQKKYGAMLTIDNYKYNMKTKVIPCGGCTVLYSIDDDQELVPVLSTGYSNSDHYVFESLLNDQAYQFSNLKKDMRRPKVPYIVDRLEIGSKSLFDRNVSLWIEEYSISIGLLALFGIGLVN